MLVFFPNGATVQLNMSERDNGQAPAKHALRRQEVDWAGLRAAAVAIGILPAARQAAQNLPLDERERFVQRAMKRCSGQKWLVKSQQDKADAIAASPTALSANVRNGADVLSETLAEDSRETRFALSKAALCSARKVKSVSVRTAKDFRDLTAAASQIGEWNKLGGDGKITLNVLTVSGHLTLDARSV